MSFQTAMRALSADATRWSATSDMLETASSAAAGMTLRDQDFSFAGGDVAAAYESLRAYAQDYLTTGSKETAGAATALVAVRRAYEGSDDASAQEVRSKWHWH